LIKQNTIKPGIEMPADSLKLVYEILHNLVPGKEVWAFGSRVQKTAREYSDLDLVVLGETPLTLAEKADLHEAFDESDLPFKVDIVDWATTNENFKKIIRKKYVVVQ
jgi:predicted nucleotidyltransferase